MKKKLLLNTATSLLMQLMTVICGFVLPRMVLEYYGSEVNGLTQSIKQFLGIISFLELGIGQVIQSNLYKPLAAGDQVLVSKVMKSGTKFFRNIAYVLIGYVAVLTVVFPVLIDDRFDWLYTAGLIGAIGVGNFAQYYFGVTDKLLLNADQKGYIHHFSQIIAVVLNTVLSVFLIQTGAPIQVVKLCASLVFLIRPLAVRFYINRHYYIDHWITYDSEPIRQKWNGVAQHVSAVVLESTDTIVLTLFASLSDVSIYAVYYLVIAGVKQFYEAATAGIQSAVGVLWAKKETDTLDKAFSVIEVGLHFTVVFLFCCIGILIVPFVQVYTDGLKDTDYTQPFFAAVLTLAYAIRCLRTPYNILILASGHYKQTQRCHVVAAVLNLVVSVLAVAAWGLVGVAVGTLAAMVYQTLWMIAYNTKNLLKWPFNNVMKQFMVDVLAAGLVFLLTGWIKLSNFSYWGWICMAVPVALIALVVCAAVAFMFYGENVKELIRMLARQSKT